MGMFRKKPVVIEARQLQNDEAAATEIASWCGGHVSGDHTPGADGERLDEMQFVIIKTLEGDMVASPGDWIIKGVNGEFYPCKPDIFEKTYDPVPDRPPGPPVPPKVPNRPREFA